ncbi:DUF835 domain-containing protein [Palaeococcus ferrophilus]|uniref:DUF835 domain-containing protein n=1 Tax=Palaeococcus ferrophilus TaxID=83868 RepID=UPI000695CBFD|nr:DUF835 domain-containing protein [Palaeococcus ferrophilus]
MIGELISHVVDTSERHTPDRVFLVSSLNEVKAQDALFFSRSFRGKEGWRVLPVSQVNGIPPTELHKLLHEAVQYLRERFEGTVVLDCLEYLVLYNGFESVVRFLHDLKDYVILYGGRLYIVTSPGVWSRREYALLHGLAKV